MLKKRQSKKVIITEKKQNSLFSIHNLLGAKILTSLRLQLSHLNEHKFRHGFGDAISPVSISRGNRNLVLRCHFHTCQISEIFDNCNKINPSFLKLGAKDQVNISLYGYSPNNSISLSQDLINLVIDFLINLVVLIDLFIQLGAIFFIFLFCQVFLMKYM